MLISKYKRVLLFIISIPLAIIFNYFVTIDLLDYINLVGTSIYITSLLIQILGWFEILVFLFDKWGKIDKIIIIVAYYMIFLFCFFARPKQREMIFNFNPFDITGQFNSYNAVIIAIFNIGVFVPLVTIHSFYIKKLKNNILLCIVYAFIIEILQVISRRGIFDVCDIILYFIGISIGIFVLKFLNGKKLLEN